MKLYVAILSVVLIIQCSCGSTNPPFPKNKQLAQTINSLPDSVVISSPYHIPDSILGWIKLKQDIKVKNYFPYMDKLIASIDTFNNWHLNEYIIVHANPWIIDSLRSFDYYAMKASGRFVYDQTELIILHSGDSLAIPDSSYATHIQQKLKTTIIDVNIPEFRLRLYQKDHIILDCPVRVGRDAEKFIYVVGHTINLKTPIGKGEIVRTDRMHKVINLDTGIEYIGTNRDDGKFTKMPMIPWIEPSINGIRYGAMIHPTTNPGTLGKAYSHGCVGTTEANAWTIYYNSPIGTQVIFRYDLNIINDQGDSIQLNDVYHLKKRK